MNAERPGLRRGATLAAAGVAPFVVGRAAFDPSSVDAEGPVVCPFRLATGLPCPICGATRGVVLASHGDGGFVEFNAVAVVALLVLVAYGLVAVALALRGAELPRLRGRPLAAGAVALGAVAWAWTLSHRDTIVA